MGVVSVVFVVSVVGVVAVVSVMINYSKLCVNSYENLTSEFYLN